MGKIFSGHVSDKGLASRIYIYSSNSPIKEDNELKTDKCLERYLSEKDIQIKMSPWKDVKNH